MGYKILISPVAQKQIEVAVWYYKNKVSGKVATLFINDYKKTFNAIRNVVYFKCFFDDFRGKALKKFPYIVFYTLDEQQKVIIVKAVFHTSQNTDKYQDL